MKRISTRDLVFMAVCLTLGLVVKRIVSPLTNALTDFFRIPGGSAAAGFSLAFLVIGKQMTRVFFAGTMMGFVQSLLALALGFSGYQGIFAVISYTLPGLVIDLTSLCMKKQGELYCFTACALACVAGAAVSNLLVFHLRGLSLVLWLLLAALSGAVGGACADPVSRRLHPILKEEKRK